jgi:hypothetical protein
MKIAKIILITALAVNWVNPMYVLANSESELQGAHTLFQNISSAVTNAVQEAEQLFYQNQGQNMASAYNKLANGTTHPLLVELQILADYSVYVKLAASGQQVMIDGAQVELPVARALSNSEFLLMPNKLTGDTQISGWYCLTNADSKISMFMGDTKTKVNSASLITQYTNNPYLDGCIYSGSVDLSPGN